MSLEKVSCFGGDTLDPATRQRLDKLFAGHPRLGSAWIALQQLHRIYTAKDLADAEAALDRFTDLCATGELPEFHSLVNTIIAWGPEILAHHQPRAPRISDGRLEGTNNKLQVLQRVAYGFTNTTNFAGRGILACGPIRNRAVSLKAKPPPDTLDATGRVDAEMVT